MKIISPINQEAHVYLPSEILELIFFFVRDGKRSQRSLWSCCLVCRQWYSAAVPALYESPVLWGWNFASFASTVSPSAHARVRRVELAQYVKHLNMSAVAYESSNSMTARLLRRVKGKLETFVAPAKSFS